MSKNILMADALKLSVAEQILLVEEIWDSIATVPESVELTKAQRTELDRRLDAYHEDPNAGDPWEVVKASILGEQ